MYVYILIWIGLAFVFRKYVALPGVRCTINKKGAEEYYYSFFAAFFVMLPLVIWTGYRGNIGDTYAYAESYSKMPLQFSDIGVYMETIKSDKGFYLFSSILRCAIGDNVEKYFLIIAMIQTIFLVHLFHKYAYDYLMSIFLFIVSTSYIAWMFNGIRQFLAVTITLASFKYILGKKYITAIMIILLASTIHGTALLVLPFVFICQGEAWNRKTILFIVCAIGVIGYSAEFTNLLSNLTENTQYAGSVSNWMALGDDGTNPLRVVVNGVPCIISLYGLRYIRKIGDPVVNLCTNFSIVSLGFYIISMVTSGIYVGRLPIYFSLYSFMLLPWEIEHLFGRDTKLVKTIMLIMYLVYYKYSIGAM